MAEVIIIGAGLAGSEAAYQLAQRGIKVILYEMRPTLTTNAHITENFAELVCSNSLRSDNKEKSAVGILHQELRVLDSLILNTADTHRVPAGDALAVDRELFSKTITEKLNSNPNIKIKREEFKDLKAVSQNNIVLIASGPLTSKQLSQDIKELTNAEGLYFFDAIAPIVYKDSINFSLAWYQSRYKDKVQKDYINCALNKLEYHTFLEALLQADKTEFKEWEKDTPYFEGCLPIEVMAERGEKTLLFGPMKPVGLTNPYNSLEKPYAVVQLRQDNTLGTLYNMVGFQTKLKHKEQEKVFSLIPALKNAVFARLGGIHRNTFINSPLLLNPDLSLKTLPNIYFAGQITGCEGYVESTSIGLLAALFIYSKLKALNISPPLETAIGSLLSHITTNAFSETFQPMNINFGLFNNPDLRNDKGKYLKGLEKKLALSKRALESMNLWRKTLEKKAIY